MNIKKDVYIKIQAVNNMNCEMKKRFCEPVARVFASIRKIHSCLWYFLWRSVWSLLTPQHTASITFLQCLPDVAGLVKCI